MSLTSGLGFKMEHLHDALTLTADGLWFEVHAENYMVEGGARLAALGALRERRPICLHGVGLSLASVEPPDPDHLSRLKILVDRIDPAAVSEHLSWSKWEGAYHPDFLPFPRTEAALAQTALNIQRTQDALGRPILVENPSLYVDVGGHELNEVEFLIELAARTGCAVLVDVNNVYVSATNLGFSSEAYLDALPPSLMGEIHLAGYAKDPDPASALLIDSHDAPVSEAVWRLYTGLIKRIGPRPTLIERDDRSPPFSELLGERERAHAILSLSQARAFVDVRP